MAFAQSHNNSTSPGILEFIEGDSKWNGTVTYNIVELGNRAELDDFNLQFNNTADMQRDLSAVWTREIDTALRLISDVADISLGLSNSINATYLIGEDTSGSLGLADLPFNAFSDFRPIVAFNLTFAEHTTNAETGGGSERMQTIVHELLHTLGLNHPHDAGGGTETVPGANPSGFGLAAPYQWQHTALSYTAAPGSPYFGEEGAFSYGRSIAPMAIDIAVLQRMYGVDTNTRTGDSTYRLTDAGTTALDLSGETIAIGRAYMGIWDAGGTDTVSYSGENRVLINLMEATLTTRGTDALQTMVGELQDAPLFQALAGSTRTEITDTTASAGGFFSSVLDARGVRDVGGFSIAQNAQIENAAGAGGNDVLIGNSLGNLLQGNGGRDALFGGGGADSLIGGNGADALYGGDGRDNLQGGAGDDLIMGGATANDLSDFVFGGAGDDTIMGGHGNDQLRGDAGADIIGGGFGADTVVGGAGDDQLTGAALGDLLFGADGDDFINGGFGFDRVNGGAGADRFYHLGVRDHGADWIQDYSAAQGDVLVLGRGSASVDQFQINSAVTQGAGSGGVAEAFIIDRPTGQIVWALVDGMGQDAINIQIGGQVFDLMT